MLSDNVGWETRCLQVLAITFVARYTFLTDVLLQISDNPASQVAELTPLVCKTRFTENLLRSDLYRVANNCSERPVPVRSILELPPYNVDVYTQNMTTEIHAALIAMKANIAAIKETLSRIEIQLIVILVMIMLLLVEPLSH